MEAGQPAQLTGTNRSIGLIPALLQKAPRRNPVQHRCTAAAGAAQLRQKQRSAKHHRRAQRQDPVVKSCADAAASPEDTSPLTSPPLIPQGTYLRPIICGALGRPGGHSEGPNTRSHPELGRENPLRRWYCTSRCGRVGRRQARQSPPTLPPQPLYAGHGQALGLTIAGWSSPVARQAHNLKVVGSNPTPATR